MDPRSPYLHHNRYASSHSFRPQPQPQFHSHPHPNFHPNPNPRSSHHSPLPAAASSSPLRPPPPPPQTQFHHASAQSQFNPQNPSFGYNPNNVSYNHHRSHPDAVSFSQSPRVLQQKPSENDLSRQLQDNVRENRIDSREFPRVSDRWLPERPYSSANMNSESYRRQLVSQIGSPVKIRQGLEGNSRSLEERDASMVMRRGDDSYDRRFQFGTNSDRSLRDSRAVPNQMNHSSSFESSRGIPFDNRVSEKQRWADGREVATDLRNSFIERGSQGVGVHERVQHSGKHQNYRSREELERHTGKGSREGSFERSRTPRKLPQKKSALLRLQKPTFSYRGEERAQFYFDDSKSMLNRVKDQISYADQGMEQQLRQGSPVELDVSFKSNSLVAKAIVTPPSTSAVVSDPDDKPRSRKKRKLLFHNKDNPNSSSIKSSEQTENLDGVILVTNDTSSSDLGLNQLEREVIACGTDNLRDVTSVAASSASEVSLEESIINSAKVMKSKKDGTNVSVAKTSCKAAKKKKNVKKVVKKVTNSNLSSSSSQPNKKCDGTIVPDGLAHDLPDYPKLENDVAMASAIASDSQLCSNQISLTPQSDKVEGICDATASQNGAETSFGRPCPSNMKRKRSGSASPISSSGHEETQINEDELKANSVDLMHAISNTYMDNILVKEILSPEVDNIEDVDKQRHKLDDSLLLEKNEAIKSSDMLLQSKDNGDCDSSEEIDMISGYNDHGLMNYGGGTVSGNAVADSGCEEYRLGRDSQLPENGNEDNIINASSMDNSRMIDLSNSGDTTIQNVAMDPSHSIGVTMLGSVNAHSLVEESHGVTNVKHLSPERVSMRVDGVSSRESPNFNVCRGVSEEDTSNSKMSEENIEAFKGNLSKSVVNESRLGTDDIVQPACRVDLTLRLSSKECSGLDAGRQPCRNVVSVLPQESSDYVEEEFIAPPKLKRGKLCGSKLKFPFTSDVNERPKISHISEAREAFTDPLSMSDFPPSQKDDIASLPNYSGGECRSAVDSVRDSSDHDEVRSFQSCITTEELVVQKVQLPKPSQLEAEQIVDVTTDLEGSSKGEKMVVDSGEGKFVLDSVTSQCDFPLEIQSLQSDERQPAGNVESGSSCHVKKDLSSLSKHLPSPRDGNGVSVPNSSIEVLELATGMLSDTGHVEASPDILRTLDSQFSTEKVDLDNEILGVPTVHGGSNMSPLISDTQNADISINSDQTVEKAHQFSVNTGTYGGQNQPAQAVFRNLGSSSLAFAASKKAASSTPPSKPLVWHRTDNVSSSAPPGSKAVSTIVPKQRQLPQNIPKSQGPSYIRKGNSLVRKPSAVAAKSSSAHNSNSLGTDEAKKNAGRNNKNIAAEPSKLGRNPANVSFEMPRTPPLPTAKPNHSSGSLGEFRASLEVESVNNIVAASTSGPVNVAESNDVMKVSEDTIKASENPIVDVGLTNIIDDHNNPNDGNLLSSNGNSITYVKRKSNQLVATSNPHVSVNNSNNNSAGPSDGYFKRRKHQLIRASLEGQPMARFLDGSVNSDEQVFRNGTLSKMFNKRQFSKVVRKTFRPSKLSLVWTLRSSQLSNVNGSLVHHQKIWPHLCPWKRATYLKNSVPNVAASLISNSSSTMSRKLLLMRKRDTVYTRSKHGFSLRKSKVLSVGGSSLKWSKSIESRSKKANEEATLAVAEAERKKREQSSALCLVSRAKNNNSYKAVQSVKLHTGERIFRIGSVCYKMDSSRRTLQRVSDDDSSHPAAGQTEKDTRVYYVPRRLVIGKDEYVRIGNGNQLVRDPKRRTRILASEKVRWSLHTARSRLARKRKYCQFFTRFGKCNKDDGKCHYIHDSSKIAVCTKFLKGVCSNADCKLTHKVIPERMPDCSYFLQGICSNKNCPYRHVHVNPNASTCEGFLRGYCADGDECRKKHSYVCPTYEATGSCPQGSKCKLHHPKNGGKGKTSKQLPDKKNGHGRYFGSIHSNVSKPGTTVTKKCTLQVTSDLADYISLDFDEEDGETSNQVYEEMYISDSDPMGFQLDGLDHLIKPIRIMNG